MSSSMLNLLGWSKEELSSRPFIDYVHPDDVQETIEAFKFQLEGKGMVEMINRYRSTDGSYKSLAWSSYLDHEQGLVFASARDITNLVDTISQLEQEKLKNRQNAKLSSLGKMAASIAHEITNPLTLVLGHIGLAKEKLESDSVVFNHLDIIEKGAERTLRIVDALRNYTYQGKSLDLECTDLISVIEESMLFCRDRLKYSNISIDLVFKSRPLVHARALELSQILLNLINNSIDAIAGQESGWIRLETFRRGPYIGIKVMDSGPSIKEDETSKIFETFYTTKERGLGTGLGLSLAREMLRRQGGDLKFTGNNPTTFEISLASSDFLKESGFLPESQG